MELLLGIGGMIVIYILAMWGHPRRPSHDNDCHTPPSQKRRLLSADAPCIRWQLSVEAIPEEDEGCQSDPVESLSDSESEDEYELYVEQQDVVEERDPAQHVLKRRARCVQALGAVHWQVTTVRLSR